MANKRQLTKMGQTARKATFNPEASKQAKSVAKKVTKIMSTSGKANSDGIKSPKLYAKSDAVGSGVIKQVLKEEKKKGKK